MERHMSARCDLDLDILTHKLDWSKQWTTCTETIHSFSKYHVQIHKFHNKWASGRT